MKKSKNLKWAKRLAKTSCKLWNNNRNKPLSITSLFQTWDKTTNQPSRNLTLGKLRLHWCQLCSRSNWLNSPKASPFIPSILAWFKKMCSPSPSIARWYLARMKNLRFSTKNLRELGTLLPKTATIRSKKMKMRLKRNHEKRRMLSLRKKMGSNYQPRSREEDQKDQA